MQQRLLAIDVLRGLTIAFMILVNNPGSWSHVYPPLLHAEWHGCTPTDLVFPFFIFTVGLSMAFSIGKNKDRTTTQLLQKALKRAGLIFLVGYLLNWFPFYHRHIFDVRLFGVLQRIGLAYGIAAVCIVPFRARPQLLIGMLLGILGIYTVLQLQWGSLSLPDNLNRWVDLQLFPEHLLYNGFRWEGERMRFDPEGLIGAFSAAGQIMVGYLVALPLVRWYRTRTENAAQRLLGLLRSGLPVGIGFLLLGLGMHYLLAYPINKPIWTASYVWYTSGWATLTLIVLLYVLDVLGRQQWAFPFRVFGLNPLASFALSIILIKIFLRIQIGDQNLVGWTYTVIMQPLFGDRLGSFVQALGMVVLVYGVALLLYRNNRVIKL